MLILEQVLQPKQVTEMVVNYLAARPFHSSKDQKKQVWYNHIRIFSPNSEPNDKCRNLIWHDNQTTIEGGPIPWFCYVKRSMIDVDSWSSANLMPK